MVASTRWASIRITIGTILGGVLGFYVMHRVEINYKEKMKERLARYEQEMERKEQQRLQDEALSDSTSILDSASYMKNNFLP
ncbi:hypothetical protein MUK42_15412 [Musa troglodytarum]|uniref:Uncharacterized protein n=1 Tax=Musa troglodytarum TaxID=320322 RepID=A0A9E7IFZ2_9LILI|nr:hypothetical protein MUK42_15412 [Musa troglodytarum]